MSIVRVFFITAATFAATSLYGYTTKADLTKMGSFMMMGLFGIIIASLVNIFMQRSACSLAISIIGVVVFIGLTAYDTQRIKGDYVQYACAGGHRPAARRGGVYDALSLYLNFINLFACCCRSRIHVGAPATRPAAGRTRPAMAASVVLLPDPDGPKSTVTPGGASKATSSEKPPRDRRASTCSAGRRP